MKNRNYSIFNGHEHSFSTKIFNDQIYTTLSTTGGSQNSSNSNVFDQITLVSMRDRPYTTHLKLDEILNYWMDWFMLIYKGCFLQVSLFY